MASVVVPLATLLLSLATVLSTGCQANTAPREQPPRAAASAANEQTAAAAPPPAPVTSVAPSASETPSTPGSAAIAANPLSFVERVGARCQAFDQYTVLFCRAERRGLLRTMSSMERIRCWWRKDPLSIRMKWLDNHPEYDESVYVAGQRDNKVCFVTRKPEPLLLPPPQINRVDLLTPVLFGKSKRPLTDFGLGAMMARVLENVERGRAVLKCTYEGVETLPDGPRVHHIRIVYPTGSYPTPMVELYFDVATELPAGIVLKTADGRVDATYYFLDVDQKVHLTDADFLLEVERAAPSATASESALPARP